jgi:hypothetical protein
VYHFDQAGVVTVKSVPNEEGRVVGINGPGGPTVRVCLCVLVHLILSCTPRFK